MTEDWRPSATIAALKTRAQILNLIRDFFATRGVLEVETPLLCHTSVTDPYIESIPALLSAKQTYYLQTSPEYAMKRLLAAGSGAIFQICKAFRQEECGRYHNPEFTMLEWYRPGFDHHNLMDEMDKLLQLVLKTQPATRLTYRDCFITYLSIDPYTISLNDLISVANSHNLHINSDMTHDDWLQLLMSSVIESQLGQDNAPCFIYDFPVSQAALARISESSSPVASRFEVYFHGIELANGFHELQNSDEQRLRFDKNLQIRQSLGLTELPIDEHLLSALSHGLPNCAGVALGVDRLIMLATQLKHIKEVMAFDIERA